MIFGTPKKKLATSEIGLLKKKSYSLEDLSQSPKKS